MLTVKQQYTLNLIQKIKKSLFTTNEIYEAQGKRPTLSKKAIIYHMATLRKQNKVLRIKKGNYMLPETIPLQVITTVNPPIASNKKAKQPSQTKLSEELPSFLAHEDIQKLLDWKNESINETNQKIQHLQLKVTKLEKQKEVLRTIKTKFC
jgi:hypothetical protein|tara:strand:- start:160 stop:612 length:453 start_codon:yes stop_codon:yes gene_type:complete